MKSILCRYPVLAVLCLALLIGVASAAITERYAVTSVSTDLSDGSIAFVSTLRAEGGGPPSCLGFSLGDSCITRRALAQCRAAVAQCGGDPIQVIQTCPLQFNCGR